MRCLSVTGLIPQHFCQISIGSQLALPNYIPGWKEVLSEWWGFVLDNMQWKCFGKKLRNKVYCLRFVIPPNSNTFPNRRRTYHVTWVKTSLTACGNNNSNFGREPYLQVKLQVKTVTQSCQELLGLVAN